MTVIAELVAENVDIWTAAIQRKSGAGRGGGKRIRLYGIERLRALILELAVRGKLVPQVAGEEPASELLKKFKSQRAVWISEKRIRKGKPLEKLSDDEFRFPPPSGWEWTRFGHLGDWGAGATPNRKTSSYYGGSTPWFKSGELVGDYISLSEEMVTDLALRECSLRLNAPGDVLIAMYGATIGKTSILEVEATTNQAVCACTPFDGVFNRYLLLLLKAMRPNFVGQGAGGAQPNISREKIIATSLCLPPFAEQRRIVAKVDELMALCDALNRESAGAMAAHQALVEVLLATLVNSADAADLARQWARLESHFDTLFTTDASMEALKQTILDLAVRGKLAEQDVGDEGAEVLLKTLLSEQPKSVGAKKMRQGFVNAEQPFPVPPSWAWARLGELSELITSGSRDWAKYLSNEGAKFVTMGNLSRGSYEMRLDKMHFVNIGSDREGTRTSLQAGDLLVSITGDVGNMALIPEEFGEAYINQHTAMIRFLPSIRGRFLPEVLRSPLAQHQFNEPQRGVKNSFRLSDIQNIQIPIPPLSEQHRIVAKVDALMSLCDALKARLADAAQTQRDLADAITERAAA